MSTTTGKDSRESNAETKGEGIIHVESAITAQADAGTKGEGASHANSAMTSPAIETIEKEDASLAKPSSPSSAQSVSTNIKAMSLDKEAMDDIDDEFVVKANSTADSETTTNKKGECLTGNNAMQTEQKIASSGKIASQP